LKNNSGQHSLAAGSTQEFYLIRLYVRLKTLFYIITHLWFRMPNHCCPRCWHVDDIILMLHLMPEVARRISRKAFLSNLLSNHLLSV